MPHPVTVQEKTSDSVVCLLTLFFHSDIVLCFFIVNLIKI
jgi:hypothetical protein